MAENTNTPNTGTGEEEKKEEEKLLAGKYKDVDTLVKSYKEAEKKITEQGQELAKLNKMIRDIEAEKLATTKLSAQKALEAQKAKIEERKKALAQKMKEAFDKEKGSPEKALEVIDEMIRQHPYVRGSLSREEYERQLQETIASQTALTKLASEHKDFELVKPKMSELWKKLPMEARKPEMLETVYFAAKALSEPDLRKKILEEIRAGYTPGTGIREPSKPSPEEVKMVDAVVDEYKKSKKF